ncbi:MAG: DUF72 domain-containing protein [Thermogutta sp.]
MSKAQPLPSVWVGTSGWTYDDWHGVFYPPEVKGTARLDFYVTQFHAVEVNATFYRYPTANMIAAWNRRLPKRFHLAAKAPRRITHLKQLSESAADWEEFAQRMTPLESLRVILWQLPPSLHLDLPRLANFLEVLKRSPILNVRHAFEFRHKSWWHPDVAGLLREYQATFVAVSHPTLPSEIISTTEFLYIRFHGLGRQLYRYDYSPDELSDWVNRISEVCRAQRIHHVYAFFNNDFQGNAIKNAKVFQGLLLARLTGHKA